MKKEFYNPVKIEFGRNSLNFLPRYIRGRKALLLTSKSFLTRGIVEQVRQDNPTIVEVIATVQPNPTIDQMRKMQQQVNQQHFDVIVALGGGSVIDAAKALAPVSEGMDLLQLLQEGIPATMAIKPIIAIPTTAGTGSEVTMWGTIWDDVNKKKYSIMDERLYCEAAILDPVLHVTIPADLTIQTGLDALSHSLESLWNNNCNPISSTYAKRAIKEIMDVLPKLVNDLTNNHYRERMLLASYYAGLAFSNTQTAIAHAMSYYMTLEKGIPHGIAASITLPSICYVYEQQLEETFIECNFTNKLKDLFAELNISTNLADYGITTEDLDKIAQSLQNTPRASNSAVNQKELIKVLKSTISGLYVR